MKVVTPEISWHGREPIFSIDLQPSSGNIQRMATVGVDKVVRMWRIRVDKENKVDIDFLANLNRHTATVNVCRFSPNGNLLASAGDDSVILLWKLNETPAPVNNIFNEEDDDNKETWVVHKSLRGHLGDVYDLCWSPDSRHIVSGSVDNSAIAWDILKDQKVALFSEHKNYVLGVAWDPLKEYIATLSSDRSCRIFNLSTKHCINNISKIVSPHAAANAAPGTRPKASRMYHDDTLQTFFRRLSFSPDGQLLITPSGLMETGEKQISATFVFTRGSFKEPAAYLPSPNKATLAVRVCPLLFELRKVPRNNGTEPVSDSAKEWEKYSTVFCLPYRVVFAVATEDSVVLYDSQQTKPFAYLSNIHYHTLSDLSWSKDGRIMVISSTDGYCSFVLFEAEELGVPYTPPSSSAADSQSKTEENQQAGGDKPTQKKPSTSSASKTSTPASTPTVAKMEVDMDTKSNSKDKSDAPTIKPKSDEKSNASTTKPKSVQKSDVSATKAETEEKSSPAPKPKTESPQTKAEEALLSSVESVSIAPSVSETKTADSGGVTAVRKESETSPSQTQSKQPKRIQFKTLSLLNKN